MFVKVFDDTPSERYYPRYLGYEDPLSPITLRGAQLCKGLRFRALGFGFRIPCCAGMCLRSPSRCVFACTGPAKKKGSGGRLSWPMDKACH